MFKRKPKTPKPQAIQNYKVAYLDKRSRSYHKIVMTAFVSVFGLSGAAYLFSTNAASSDTNNSTNTNTSLMLVAAGLVIAAAVLIFALFVVSRSHRK